MLFKKIVYKNKSKLFIWVCGSCLSHAGALLGYVGSFIVAHGCSASIVCEIVVPQPETEAAPPALQGGFLTTRPAWKSLLHIPT